MLFEIRKGFWWYRTLEKLRQSDSSLLIRVALTKAVKETNVFV